LHHRFDVSTEKQGWPQNMPPANPPPSPSTPTCKPLDRISLLLVKQMASYVLAVTDQTYLAENGRVLMQACSAEFRQDERVFDAHLEPHEREAGARSSRQ